MSGPADNIFREVSEGSQFLNPRIARLFQKDFQLLQRPISNVGHMSFYELTQTGAGPSTYVYADQPHRPSSLFAHLSPDAAFFSSDGTSGANKIQYLVFTFLQIDKNSNARLNITLADSLGVYFKMCDGGGIAGLDYLF